MEDEDYELSRSEQKKAETARADANNAQNVKNAADVAIATKNPYAVAAGTIVKGVDAATGGAGSELLGKALTRANKITPGGGLAQKGLNKINESGAGDAAGKAASIYSQKNGPKGEGNQAPNQVKTPKGGEQGSSLPSSGDKKTPQPGDKNAPQNPNAKTGEKGDAKDKAGKEKKVPETSSKNPAQESEEEKKSKGYTRYGLKSPLARVALLVFAPYIFSITIIIMVVASVVGYFDDYEDAIGISATQGEETGGVVFSASSQEQQDFFNRVLEVRNTYLAQGKNVDPLKVVATYHVLKARGASINYEAMTTEAISDIADCMFLNNVYSDETFKNNLVSYLIPKYLPNTTDAERNSIADDVFEYVENYYKLIGKEITSNCSSVGSCNYTISGFYIPGKGNVKKELNINDLYVRLMQCGNTSYYNYGGTFGQPLEGEELVPFEKYALGVAYAEIGPGAPEEAFKAQMVAARSFILSRPFDMGGWRTLQQESDGRWVIQVAACTADQVYCDPDQGCSTVIGGNGQTSQVYSGTGHGRTWKGPLPENSPLRQYAADVQGELLVNNQGYVIQTGYLSAESNQFTSLARAGLDHKQILLQVYSQGRRSYGASDIYKASCGNCVANGEYASWKQNEGEWINVPLGGSGKTIKQIGCLATSLAIQVARSGVPTNISDFNPGTFVQALSNQGAFGNSGALLSYASVETVAPTFRYQSYVDVSGMSRQDKLNTIKGIVNQPGVYAVAEVKGNTGQHWVAIDSVNGDTINMMDPGSNATDMWAQYNWANTSRIVYYKVG